MRLMAADNRPTALYSANHEATFGVLGALVQLGVQVPEQLSLVCHEEALWFPYWHPPITVVDNGARDLGELAAEQLLRRIDNRPDNGDPGEEGVGRPHPRRLPTGGTRLDHGSASIGVTVMAGPSEAADLPALPVIPSE
ncbi:substrate-binding domain-containing protein [Streptomyces sp. L7]